MKHVELAETEDAFVILVDKHSVDRFAVERAVNAIESDSNFSHIPEASEEEEIEILGILESMTDEERAPSDLVIRRSL